MKTRQGFCIPAKSRALRLLLPALLVGTAAASEAPGTRDQKAVVMENYVVDASKTHTLFMGADISINLDKDLYPVRDVAGTSWVIDINGKDRVVSAKKAPLNLKITPTLKLTEVSATIAGFRREASYSFNNDPSVLLTRGMDRAASMNADLLAVSANAQHRADAVANKALAAAALFAASNDQFGDKAIMFTAQTVFARTHPPAAIPGYVGYPPNPLVNPTFNGLDGPALSARLDGQAALAAASQTTNGNEPTGPILTRGLDAMDVEFDISSTRTLQNPYVVTMTRFRLPGSKPGVVQNLVYARALDPIDSHVDHVHFSEEGFPFDYELVDFQLHIYNKGVEIATNLSSKRVELTRDEAFEYVKMEYVAFHRGETLAAVPAMGRLPAELPTRLATGQYADTFFVPVSKEGLAHEAFADRVCTRRIEDPFLETVVKDIRFKPALAEGKPVDGVAAVNLTRLQF